MSNLGPQSVDLLKTGEFLEGHDSGRIQVGQHLPR